MPSALWHLSSTDSLPSYVSPSIIGRCTRWNISTPFLPSFHQQWMYQTIICLLIHILGSNITDVILRSNELDLDQSLFTKVWYEPPSTIHVSSSGWRRLILWHENRSHVVDPYIERLLFMSDTCDDVGYMNHYLHHKSYRHSSCLTGHLAVMNPSNAICLAASVFDWFLARLRQSVHHW